MYRISKKNQNFNNNFQKLLNFFAIILKVIFKIKGAKKCQF